jgi:hypothetical protein
MAFAAATEAVDAEAAEAALEAAIGSCQDIDEWQAAAHIHGAALGGLDPEEFLTDRCVNGPPDLTETSLCESFNVER